MNFRVAGINAKYMTCLFGITVTSENKLQRVQKKLSDCCKRITLLMHNVDELTYDIGV